MSKSTMSRENVQLHSIRLLAPNTDKDTTQPIAEWTESFLSRFGMVNEDC